MKYKYSLMTTTTDDGLTYPDCLSVPLDKFRINNRAA